MNRDASQLATRQRSVCKTALSLWRLSCCQCCRWPLYRCFVKANIFLLQWWRYWMTRLQLKADPALQFSLGIKLTITSWIQTKQRSSTGHPTLFPANQQHQPSSHSFDLLKKQMADQKFLALFLLCRLLSRLTNCAPRTRLSSPSSSRSSSRSLPASRSRRSLVVPLAS